MERRFSLQRAAAALGRMRPVAREPEEQARPGDRSLGFVSGHDFNRAVQRVIRMGFSPRLHS